MDWASDSGGGVLLSLTKAHRLDEPGVRALLSGFDLRNDVIAPLKMSLAKLGHVMATLR